jgi:serine/threonine protein kinase
MASLSSVKSNSYESIDMFYQADNESSKEDTKVCLSVSDIFDISADVVACKLGNTRQVVIKSFDDLNKFYLSLRAMKIFSNESGCAKIIGKGIFRDKPVIVMDPVGGNLQSYIKNRKFEVSEVMRICNQILDPLSKIHLKGLVHSDLNPSNICINKNGVVIVDLERKNFHGETFYPKATYEYAPPSWFLDCSVKFRNDLWSLALILIEMYTNEKPIKHCLNPENQQKIINNRQEDLKGIEHNLQKDLAIAFLCMHEYQNLFGEEDFEKLINHIKKNDEINEFYFDFMFEPKNDLKESIEEDFKKSHYKLRELGFELFNSDEKNKRLKDLMKASQKKNDFYRDLERLIEFIKSLCFEGIDVEDVNASNYQCDPFLLRLIRKK